MINDYSYLHVRTIIQHIYDIYIVLVIPFFSLITDFRLLFYQFELNYM